MKIFLNFIIIFFLFYLDDFGLDFDCIFILDLVNEIDLVAGFDLDVEYISFAIFILLKDLDP